MALTASISKELGYQAPDFKLFDSKTEKEVSYRDVRGENGTVVMFICNHCPFVIHVIDQLVTLANDYMSIGFGFVAISVNDVERYPQDAPEFMKAFAVEKAFPFPYLYDESQETAKMFYAACTPDFSVFNKEDSCVYRGQLDDSRPSSSLPPDGKSLRMVLDAILRDEKIDAKLQRPSIGCGIKWKSEK